MKHVSLIILRDNHRLLMHLRDDKPTIPYPNYWALIGGGIEENETAYDALRREIEEEISSDVKNIRKIEEIVLMNDPEPNCRDQRIFLYQGEIEKDIKDINLTEGQRLGYFTFPEFRDLKVPPVIKKHIMDNYREISRI